MWEGRTGLREEIAETFVGDKLEGVMVQGREGWVVWERRVGCVGVEETDRPASVAGVRNLVGQRELPQ